MIADRAFPCYRWNIIFCCHFSFHCQQFVLETKSILFLQTWDSVYISFVNIEFTKVNRFPFSDKTVFVVYAVPSLHMSYYFLRWVRWLCYFIMLGLVRAARQQLRQAFGVRGQWLKPLPCTGPAHSCGNHWRGDKRLVAFPFHWERQPTFCHQSKYSPPSPCGMINI